MKEVERYMAKNNKPVKTNKEEISSSYVSPTDKWWGKAFIWLIIVGMVGLVFVSLILVIIDAIG